MAFEFETTDGDWRKLGNASTHLTLFDAATPAFEQIGQLDAFQINSWTIYVFKKRGVLDYLIENKHMQQIFNLDVAQLQKYASKRNDAYEVKKGIAVSIYQQVVSQKFKRWPFEHASEMPLPIGRANWDRHLSTDDDEPLFAFHTWHSPQKAKVKDFVFKKVASDVIDISFKRQLATLMHTKSKQLMLQTTAQDLQNIENVNKHTKFQLRESPQFFDAILNHTISKEISLTDYLRQSNVERDLFQFAPSNFKGGILVPFLGDEPAKRLMGIMLSPSSLKKLNGRREALRKLTINEIDNPITTTTQEWTFMPDFLSSFEDTFKEQSRHDSTEHTDPYYDCILLSIVWWERDATGALNTQRWKALLDPIVQTCLQRYLDFYHTKDNEINKPLGFERHRRDETIQQLKHFGKRIAKAVPPQDNVWALAFELAFPLMALDFYAWAHTGDFDHTQSYLEFANLTVFIRPRSYLNSILENRPTSLPLPGTEEFKTLPVTELDKMVPNSFVKRFDGDMDEQKKFVQLLQEPKGASQTAVYLD